MWNFLLFVGSIFILRWNISELQENPLMLWHVILAFSMGLIIVRSILYFVFDFLLKK